jgi:hypothetical protein
MAESLSATGASDASACARLGAVRGDWWERPVSGAGKLVALAPDALELGGLCRLRAIPQALGAALASAVLCTPGEVPSAAQSFAAEALGLLLELSVLSSSPAVAPAVWAGAEA